MFYTLASLNISATVKLTPAYALNNPLPNEKILDVTKLKTFADSKLNIAKMTISVFDRVENLWEKEKMLVISIFSCFHSVFHSLLL